MKAPFSEPFFLHLKKRLHTGILVNKKNIFYAYLGLLIWLPLPLGSMYPWGISIAELWCFSLAIFVILHCFKHGGVLPQAFKTARPALLLLTLYLCWLIFQCIPLPIGLLTILSPNAAALYESSNASILMAPISIDTHATWLDFIEAAYLSIFFCLALYLIDSKQKIRLFIYVILLSALAQAMYGAFMILSGIEYSFFISKQALHSHINSATGTFLSRNSLACYLEMSLALGIGYMLSMMKDGGASESWKNWLRKWSDILLSPKARLRLILILLCLGLVLTHSRGGNIGFFASLTIAGVIFMLFARKKPRATIIFLTSVILLDIFLIGSWVGVSKVMTRLENTSVQTEQRDEVYAATLPMVEDYWLTGTGAGTYFEAFPAYKIPLLSAYSNHAQNDYLEILSEQGIIGFGLLASVVLFALFISIQTLRRRRSSLMLAMSFSSLMGIIALMIHSTVEYNLQILANSSLFMVLLALPMICRRLSTER
jgi:O-antigen ligase